MSHFLDRLTYFSQPRETFADGHGRVTSEDRTWEDAYRNRWASDKIVRSTHGVNCTGSCSWKIYVKGGIVTWEIQQIDYPRTRWDMPNHEPRGCARGASYSWYLYSANRVKYPMVRGRLLKAWRQARQNLPPVEAWAAIVGDEATRRDYQQVRGLGGFARSSWDEVNEIVAAANIHTIKRHGPDRIIGFSPIPAMSMVSYAAGTRYLSLIGGVCMSFYDWYCDLPPSSPQVWGEQTDVPESADWYNSSYIIAWGSNVPQTRTPDAHFFTEVRYKGTTTVAITPDYSEVAKLCDIWMHPKQGTDAAVAMAMGHVILKEFYFPRGRGAQRLFRRIRAPLHRHADAGDAAGAHPAQRRGGGRAGPLSCALRIFRTAWARTTTRTGRPSRWTKTARWWFPRAPSAFAGGPDGRADKGQWNLEDKEAEKGRTRPAETVAAGRAQARQRHGARRLPLFRRHPHTSISPPTTRPATCCCASCRSGSVALREGKALVATVFDLLVANYGVARGLDGEQAAQSFDDDVPYTPAWQEQITGVPRDQVIAVARAVRAERARHAAAGRWSSSAPP